VDGDFELVFNRDITFDASGWNIIPFTWPFTWNGTSNILVEISYEDNKAGSIGTVLADDFAFNAGIVSSGADHCLHYEDADYVEIPVDNLISIDTAITISFWQYGNPAKQPQNDVLFAAIDHKGNRILSVHLPWSNESVYWDAGYADGGYDRITRPTTPETYEGQWNHWSFTKNANTGYMAIYKNGTKFIWGWGKYNTIDSIHHFTIGAYPNKTNFYDGMVDEFRIWDTELDEGTIASWMHKSVDNTHPAYNNLVGYYQFDEATGLSTSDAVTGENGALNGYPEWKNYMGFKRVRDFTQNNFRPQMKFEMGIYDPLAMDSLFLIDTLAKGQIMITLFEDTLNPTPPTDTLTKWPTYYNNYVYDANGIATDSAFVTPDDSLFKKEYPYYGTPYEVIVKWELGRFITPYGNGLSLGDGWTWIYDVTDFRSMLYDSVHLQAGNFQELLDMKFYMIEGTPNRDVLSLDRLWTGSYHLNAFDVNVPPLTVALHPNAESYKLKITTSGHDFDNATNCAEFCQKDHWVDVDGEEQYAWEIIDECADNPLYPQGGTWIYDRAGWCPGAKVTERHIEVEPAGIDSVELDYNCESDPYGRYNVSSFSFQYGPHNLDLGAAITEIQAPNNDNLMLRINPVCGSPVIKILNNGATSILILDIEYGPEGGVMQTMQWTGLIDFLDTATVTLDPIDWTDWQSGSDKFIVTVSNPNGQADEYEYNNTLTSRFNLAPEYPNELVVELRTNKRGYHNNWEILDELGNVIVERDGFSNETIYRDTLLLDDGCYTFKLYDSGDDGLSFWANNHGSGYLRFRDMDNFIIYNPDPDFGKFVYQDFTVGLAVSTQDLIKTDFIDIYPNPASNRLNLSFALTSEQDIKIDMFDISGRKVYSDELPNVNNNMHSIDISAFVEGMYFCVISTETEKITRKIIVSR